MNDSRRLPRRHVAKAGTQEGHMYERHEEPNTGFAAGLITGAIVGAGLALLLAPKSGAALRDELGESWISLREAVGRRYRELAEHAGVELDNLQERIDQTADAVESSASKLVEAAAREARQVWGERSRKDV
jgi:gas vesicle protein